MRGAQKRGRGPRKDRGSAQEGRMASMGPTRTKTITQVAPARQAEPQRRGRGRPRLAEGEHLVAVHTRVPRTISDEVKRLAREREVIDSVVLREAIELGLETHRKNDKG